jgi:hypothetical protein
VVTGVAWVASCSSDGTVVPTGDDGGAPGAPPVLDAGAFPAPCPEGHQPTDPIDYATCEVSRALVAAQSKATVRLVLVGDPLGASALAKAGVTLDPRPESYGIVPAFGETFVVGRDAVGAMYGGLDVAERLRDDGAASIPPSTPIFAFPAVSVRAANPFLVLPANGETTATWWFRDASFWVEYLDMMAHARLDFLDLHAMYDTETTLFPNALLYFGTSATFPEVGVSADDRAANVAMLDRVVSMAAARGIRVGLMSYRSDTAPRADGNGPSLSDADLATYTREGAADIVKRVPGLDRLGFRIGESGHAASWYVSSFVAGVTQAATGAKVYTRTWGTTKPDVLSIVAAANGDTILEAKYNGEHFGPPYVVAGASMSQWADYSYQGYLAPPTPYTFVLQIRAAGTHRIFRFASFERARRAALSLGLSPRVAGFTLEAAHAYSPQRDFMHAPQDVFSPWTFRRDELSYALLGRLAYDPTTPEARFRAMLAARVGTDALWDALQASSDVAPWIETALTCGPDSRDYAPELELDADVAWWASSAVSRPGCQHHVAFDGFSVAVPAEAADDLVAARATTKLSPLDVARVLLADAQAAGGAARVAVDPGNAEARDVVRDCVATSDLASWFAHKLRAATALAVYQRTAATDFLAAARAETALADTAFTQLATDTAYVEPWEERLRMQGLGYLPFHWRMEVPHLADDPAAIDAVVQQVAAIPPTFAGTLPAAQAWLDAPRAAGPALASLDVTPNDPTAPSWTVAVALAAPPPAGAEVRVLWKPFDSETDWTPVAANGSGTSWSAHVAGGGAGGMFAVEIAGGPGLGWRLPDVMLETPYRAVAP